MRTEVRAGRWECGGRRRRERVCTGRAASQGTRGAHPELLDKVRRQHLVVSSSKQ